MGFFTKLFRKRIHDNKPAEPLEPNIDQLFATNQIQQLAQKYKRSTTILNPLISDIPINPNVSKFGGIPNLSNFNTYPYCDACETPLNFVLQLYKTDFSEHYFPENKDLFQLFRCPNPECPAAYADILKYDLKMFVYYFKDTPTAICTIDMPSPNPSTMEIQIPDCRFTPQSRDEYACYLEYEKILEETQINYGNKLYSLHLHDHSKLFYLYLETYHPIGHTKIGGWPSYCQYPTYPECNCGKQKEFFFQLSSDDLKGKDEVSSHNEWAPYNIVIGDAGNIYFYVCKSCGEESIESNWDCF